MANFVVVVDADPDRRARFIERVKPVLPPVDGLATGTCSSGNFSSAWAVDVGAPISDLADDEGAAVVWGDAIKGPASERATALELKKLWRDVDGCPPLTYDGFYAAVVYHSGFGLAVGGDILGIFPIYYYSTDDVLLVGSSPELFKYHRSFRAEFNPRGLVGILLTMHMFDGETLWRGVRRLDAGHALVWRPGSAPKEVRQFQLPVSTEYFALPFSGHVNLLDRVLDETVARHVPAGKQYSQTLSGGLDSRMIAGYLNRKGISPVAMTLGLRSDVEMRCAIPVARALGLDHAPVNVGYDQYPACAEIHAKWEHVANGFNNIMTWGVHPHLRKLAPRVIAGFMLDAVIGTSWIEKAYVQSSDALSFDAFFFYVNRWGIKPEILRTLLRKEVFGDLVDETVARIKSVYEGYSALESQRAWCFNLSHRERFHVGSMAWELSFGAWPVIPSLDRQLLEAAGGMPAATIAERRGQKELLCTRFPHLANLPLDHNSYDVEPLRPSLRRQLARYVYWRFPPIRSLERAKRNWKGEQRYYYRIYDLNGPGWIAVRKLAEPYRDRVLDLVHKDVLETVLPPPDVRLAFGDGIIEASGPKSLLGFMLWSKDHL